MVEVSIYVPDAFEGYWKTFKDFLENKGITVINDSSEDFQSWLVNPSIDKWRIYIKRNPQRQAVAHRDKLLGEIATAQGGRLIIIQSALKQESELDKWKGLFPTDKEENVEILSKLKEKGIYVFISPFTNTKTGIKIGHQENLEEIVKLILSDGQPEKKLVSLLFLEEYKKYIDFSVPSREIELWQQIIATGKFK